MKERMEAIKPPILTERLPSIQEFYCKVAKINSEAEPKEIFAWMEEFPNVCMETVDEFKANWEANIVLALNPFIRGPYLSNPLIEKQIKKEIKNVDDMLAGKYDDGRKDTWIEESERRNEISELLFDELLSNYQGEEVLTDLSNFTIKG